jgi:hypothetical protein
MSISPSATALCSRRNVPLRSASEMRIAYSPLMSVIAATNGTARQPALKTLTVRTLVTVNASTLTAVDRMGLQNVLSNQLADGLDVAAPLEVEMDLA